MFHQVEFSHTAGGDVKWCSHSRRQFSTLKKQTKKQKLLTSFISSPLPAPARYGPNVPAPFIFRASWSGRWVVTHYLGVWHFLKKLKIHLPYDPAVTVPDPTIPRKHESLHPHIDLHKNIQAFIYNNPKLEKFSTCWSTYIHGHPKQYPEEILWKLASDSKYVEICKGRGQPRDTWRRTKWHECQVRWDLFQSYSNAGSLVPGELNRVQKQMHIHTDLSFTIKAAPQSVREEAAVFNQ